ncbi:MAG: hypothetical protein AB7F22_10435 [Reyranella sp.]
MTALATIAAPVLGALSLIIGIYLSLYGNRAVGIFCMACGVIAIIAAVRP